jgi:hypothetical protein
MPKILLQDYLKLWPNPLGGFHGHPSTRPKRDGRLFASSFHYHHRLSSFRPIFHSRPCIFTIWASADHGETTSAPLVWNPYYRGELGQDAARSQATEWRMGVCLWTPERKVYRVTVAVVAVATAYGSWLAKKKKKKSPAPPDPACIALDRFSFPPKPQARALLVSRCPVYTSFFGFSASLPNCPLPFIDPRLCYHVRPPLLCKLRHLLLLVSIHMAACLLAPSCLVWERTSSRRTQTRSYPSRAFTRLDSPATNWMGSARFLRIDPAMLHPTPGIPVLPPPSINR